MLQMTLRLLRGVLLKMDFKYNVLKEIQFMKKYIIVGILVFLSIISVFVFGSCLGVEDQAPKLNVVSGVSYDGSIITWDPVENAVGYEILIDGVSQGIVTDTSYRYQIKNDFNFTIKAKGDQGYSDSPQSDIYHYKSLDTVSGFQVVDGCLIWDAVENATGYRVKVDGKELAISLEQNKYEGISDGGTERIAVRAIAEENHTFYTSTYSEEKIVSLLKSPVLQFDKTSKTVYWNSVTNASGYAVRVVCNGEVAYTALFGDATNSFKYDYDVAGEYFVSIKAVAAYGGELNDSKYSSDMKIVKLQAPIDVELQQTDNGNTMVKFDAVYGANCYRVMVNGVEFETVYGRNFEYKFPASQTESVIKFVIVSVGDGGAVLDSNESGTFTITKPSVPGGVSVNNSKISWNAVGKASYYEVFIDGVPYSCEGTEMMLPDTSVGSHQIYVRACGNGVDVTMSDPSVVLTVTKLSKPTELKISNSILSWNIVQGAESYTVYIDSIQYNTDSASFEIDPGYISSSSDIKVIAIGNSRDKLSSEYSDTLIVHRLAAPSGLSTDNLNIKWNHVPGARGYTLKVNNVIKSGITGTTYPWEGFSSGSKSVSVKAEGDGSLYFDSPYSEGINVTKLEAPVPYIDGMYRWGGVPNANCYEFEVGNVTQRLNSTVREYYPNYTTSGTKVFRIRAVGNGFSTVDSEWAELEHNVTIETAVSDGDGFTVTRNGSEYTVTLTEYFDSKTYIFNIDGKEAFVNSSSYSINRTQAGSFVVKIAVKGDGITTVDSSYCASRKITVLNEVKNIELEYFEDDVYFIKWDAVSEASGYVITYTIYEGGNLIRSRTVDLTNPSVKLDLTDATRVVVTIVAVGNSIDVFDSSGTTESLTVLGD